MKTCVCFYGLPQRSIKYTLDNIRENVLFDDPDIYVHTYDTTVAQCIRGGEPPTPVDPSDIRYLNPTKYRIDSEKEFNSTFDFQKYENYGNPFPGDPGGRQTLHNLLRELHSIKQVWEMIPDPNKYDRIIMTRADLMFSRNLNFECPPGTLLTQVRPQGSINHNDFFAIGSPQAIEPWANRIDYAEDFCEFGKKVEEYITREKTGMGFHKGLHPETLVSHIVYRFGLKDSFLPIKVDRIRASGKIAT